MAGRLTALLADPAALVTGAQAARRGAPHDAADHLAALVRELASGSDGSRGGGSLERAA